MLLHSRQKLGGEPCHIPVTSAHCGIVCRLRGRLRERDGGGRLQLPVSRSWASRRPHWRTRPESVSGCPGYWEPGSRSPDARVLADHRLLSYVDPGRRRRGRDAAGFTRQPHWDRARQLGHPCERGLGCRAGYSDLCLRDAGPRWAGGNRLLVPYGRLSAAVDQTISARLGSNALSLSGAASDLVPASAIYGRRLRCAGTKASTIS